MLKFIYCWDIIFMEIMGIIREIDGLGRLTIPKELRKTFNMTSEVEIIATTDGILIRNPQYIVVKKDKDA